MAHARGGQVHLPHGRLNAILLPHVLEYNRQVMDKYACLARGAGLGGSADTIAFRNLKNALIRLRRELKLPETLAQAGKNLQDPERTLRAVLADPCCSTNPVPVTEEGVRQILWAVSGNG